MTVLDLIKSSLRLIGVIASNETPNSSMAEDARDTLNVMLGSWQTDGLLSLQEQQVFNVVAGTNNYTIGLSQTWNGHKPLKVINAKIRDSANNDFDLKEINYSDYLRIFSKNDTGIPHLYSYFPEETTGKLYLYYTPDTNYTITLLSQKAFTEYTSLTTDVNLPSGYLAAIKYNLAVELSPEYSQTINQLIINKADEYLTKIKRSNLKKPAKLQYDGIFGKPQNYDIMSDTYY